MSDFFKITYKGTHNTIARSLILRGNAPFSGKAVKMTLIPNQQGRIFFTYNGIIVPVEPDSIKLNPNSHTTTLISDGQEIGAVEHLLSALYGLGVSSLQVDLKGDCQVPALDSSAEQFAHLISKIG